MYTLYHFPLCPFSRLVRVMLVEKQVSFRLVEEKPWQLSDEIALLNPALEIPILTFDNYAISSIYAICEFLEETFSNISLLSGNNLKNAEIRRVFNWFCVKFYSEVTKYIFEEKIISHYKAGHSPQSNIIRAARYNLSYHLDYIEFLLKSRKWLAGESLSIADLAAATQLSTLDYLGDVFWEKHSLAKEWYSILKSRPSFRTLLSDRILGFTPPSHYQNLDF